jgi:hypothetical protein
VEDILTSITRSDKGVKTWAGLPLLPLGRQRQDAKASYISEVNADGAKVAR